MHNVFHWATVSIRSFRNEKKTDGGEGGYAQFMSTSKALLGSPVSLARLSPALPKNSQMATKTQP
jgi:hypothetical protein